jgi:hypothetical protein
MVAADVGLVRALGQRGDESATGALACESGGGYFTSMKPVAINWPDASKFNSAGQIRHLTQRNFPLPIAWNPSARFRIE